MILEVNDTELAMIMAYRKRVTAVTDLILFAQKHWRECNGLSDT